MKLKFIVKNFAIITILTNGIGLAVANVNTPPATATIVLPSPDLMLMSSNDNNLSNSKIEPMLKSALERADMSALAQKQIENIKINLQQPQIKALAHGQKITTKITTGKTSMVVNLELDDRPSPYKHFVVFGDSLSDIGAFNRLLKIFSFRLLKMSGVFYHGSIFSNGPLTVQYMNAMLNFQSLQLPEFYDPVNHKDIFPFDKTNYDVDYATAGATISNWTQDCVPVSVLLYKNNAGAQIQNFISNYRLPKKEDNTLLGGYFFGANDYWFNNKMANAIDNKKTTTKTFETNIQAIIKSIQNNAFTHIKTLLNKTTAKGMPKNYVQHLLISNLPDLGKLPFDPFNMIPTRMSIATSYWNEDYAKMITKLQKIYPNRITQIQLDKYSTKLQKRFPYKNNINVCPVTYVFNPFTRSIDAVRSPKIGNACLNNYFYFDGMHTSSIVNYEAANLMYNDLYGWKYN